MKKQFSETMIVVENILKRHQGTRDSDKALILEYLLQETDLKNESYELKNRIAKAVYTQMPSFETITRARRRIQESGSYRSTLSTQNGRKAKAKAMKAMFR